MDQDYDSQPLEGDSQPFLGLDPLRRGTDTEASDSEDEGFSAVDRFAGLSIPQKLKNILLIDSGRDMASNLQDDSESDNESLHKLSLFRDIDLDKLNAEAAKNRNKYANFPLPPPGEENEKAETAAVKKTRKPREKKKRRDKGKKPTTVDIFELQEKARRRNLDKVFEGFAKEETSDEEEEETVKLKKKKKGGRKTRKEQSLIGNVVDENGERIARTTEFLDTDTDDSEADERALSKKEELEMTREQERLRRAANARLKPALVVKSYDEFLKRREQRESDMLASLETSSQREIEQKIQQQQEQLNQQDKSKTQVIGDDDDDDDDDLIIENDPAELAAAAMRSPERSKIPLAAHLSPLRQSTLGIRNHNKSMLNRITTEGYKHRIKMEQDAKSRGHFASATERAKRLLEKEKNARMIDAQVKSHFEKYGYANQNEDDEEEDEDYQEEGEEEEAEEAHGEEEDSEEDEFAIEDFKVDLSHKRKNSISDDEDDEQDADVAVKRWKGKKTRKSIFDDSDDEEDITIKKVVKQPVPAHSISNFFKSKEVVQEEPIEDKPLGRLKRRMIQPDVDEDEDHDDDNNLDDAMDVDEPVHIKRIPRSPIPRGPQEKNEFLEEEAEEEEDEFFGAGGEDIDTGENLDEFEEDGLLVHENNEHIDEAALREVFNKQDAESDNNFIQRLLTDVTGGGLRKQKAAAEAGLMIDDLDLYDEEDNDLIAIRRAAEARRRKLLKKKGGDPLENLLTNPKTAAFAKAGQAISEEKTTAFLSDSDVEDDKDEDLAQPESTRARLVIEEEEEEEEEEDAMEIAKEEEVFVNEFNPMESPRRNPMSSPSRNTFSSPSRFATSPVRNNAARKVMASPVRNQTSLAPPVRGGLVSSTVITSADDEEDEVHVEALPNSNSPLNNRKTLMFKSPVRMERFKRLISETNGTGADAPRVGFGSLSRTASQDTMEEMGVAEEEESNTRGSIGGFLVNKKEASENKKSKLSSLSKKTAESFIYAE